MTVLWWILIGWWWRPLCWLGRVALWLIFWPIGLWRSLRNGQRKSERRARSLSHSPAEIGKGYRYPFDDR